MLIKTLARILAAVLFFCSFATALCEEEWPDEIFSEYEDEEEYEDDFYFEEDFPSQSDESAWYDAMDAYDMFVNCGASVDYDAPNRDGTKYLVIDERFTCMQDLLDFARFFFSDEIAEVLIGSGMYSEEDGRLYARDIVNYLDENISNIEVMPNAREDRVDYDVVITYLSPDENGKTSERLVYTRLLVGDEWRFTVFPSI